MESTHSQNHRHLARRELYFYPEVTDTDTGLPFGRLIDMHEEGLLVMRDDGAAPLPLGSIYHIDIHVPKALELDGLKDAKATVQVRWSRPFVPRADDGMVSIGAQFVDLPQTSRTALRLLIDRCELSNGRNDDDDDVNQS
ncbi:MAG: PilZ domain-containing protein [Planctomycetota bacterium]|jgi:hypothetical protein|nr:PilZ domain-containing protein [Planctomycetota bacterium]